MKTKTFKVGDLFSVIKGKEYSISTSIFGSANINDVLLIIDISHTKNREIDKIIVYNICNKKVQKWFCKLGETERFFEFAKPLS